MDLGNQNSLRREKEMEEGKAREAAAKLLREAKEEDVAAKHPLPTITTTSSSPCSSPSHDFSFTICFHSPPPSVAAATSKSPSALSRTSLFDLSPADDIFFHGHLLPLQLFSRPPPPPVSPRSSQDATPGPPAKDSGGEQASCCNGAISSSSSSSSAASSNGDAKDRAKNHHRLLSSLFGGVGRWRKGGEAAEREEEEERRRKRSAFDAMTRLLRRYVSAVEPLFSMRGGGRGRGRRGDLSRRPYSFSGNPSAGAAAAVAAGGKGEEWLRRRRGELSAPASMRTSPANSGLLVAAPPGVGCSSDDSTMEELQSAIEAAIAHCKNSIAVKEEKCNC